MKSISQRISELEAAYEAKLDCHYFDDWLGRLAIQDKIEELRKQS